jgi:arylsulfatase A-like enzyme
VNILFVTLDQFRADSYSAAGHHLVATPTLDRIAREGTRLASHYSQSAPCSPGRAALYTGTYQMNNRVVANGSPSPSRLDNIAKAARRAGYDPTLFGYTDQGVDLARVVGADDPRLDDYDGILDGFSIGCYMPTSHYPWLSWLRSRGVDVPNDYHRALELEPQRSEELSLSAFLTDRFLEWLPHQDSGWFAHLSYLRPHPPYAAAGRYSTMYDPDDVTLPIAPVDEHSRHPLHDLSMRFDASAAPGDEVAQRAMRTQYYGMISEIDAQLARIVDELEARGEWGETLVVITSDHGEQLGDHGLKEKLAFFPQSYHIIGIWRDPRRLEPKPVIEHFTENVDLFATLCDAMGVEIPSQVDGRTLTPLLDGAELEWRTAAHYEWDWRYFFIGSRRAPWPHDRTLERQNLAVSLSADVAYVQFGDGSFKCFDLLEDPTWRTECRDDSRILRAAQELLVWRQEHLARDTTDLLLRPDRPGRWPALV